MFKGIKLLTTALVATGMTLWAYQAGAETIMRLAHHHAVGGQVDKTANLFAKLVGEKTGGDLTIKIFPAAQLGQELEAHEQLNLGVLDMTITSVGLFDIYWPPAVSESLPFIWRDWDHVEAALNGTWAEELGKGMLANSNTRIVGIMGLGFRDMFFRGEAVTDVAGMKGLKMRSPENTAWIRMFELLGAKPTPVTWGEVYTAMQTGVAAGLEAPAMAALDMKLNEVTKAVVRTQHMFATMSLLINKNRYDELSPAFQKAVGEAGREAAAWSTQFGRDGAMTAYETLKDKGLQVLDPDDQSAWAAAMKPRWDEVAVNHPDTPRMIQILVDTK